MIEQQALSDPSAKAGVREHVQLEQGTFAYEQRGAQSAPLVVLQHGFPDHPGTFFPLMDGLATAGFRCVAPYLRGYAPSTLDGPFHAEQLGADLVDLTRKLSPDGRAVLVGHDWGAVAAYAAMRQAPERFRCGVTLAVPHVTAFQQNVLFSPSQQKRSAYMAFFMLPALPERIVPRNDFAFIDTLWRRWSPGYTPDPSHMKQVKSVLRASMPAPLGHYRALIPSVRGRHRAKRAASTRIDVPVLHLHGADDGCIAYEYGKGQQQYFTRDFESVELDGVGHFLHLEDPDDIAKRILTFVGRHT